MGTSIFVFYILWVVHLNDGVRNMTGAYPNRVECEKTLVEVSRIHNNVWGCSAWQVTYDSDTIIDIKQIKE